jgi:sulfite exporter TauE/SafE
MSTSFWIGALVYQRFGLAILPILLILALLVLTLSRLSQPPKK